MLGSSVKLLVVEPQEMPDWTQLLKSVDHVYNHCGHLSESQQNGIYDGCRSISPEVGDWIPPVASDADNRPRALRRFARVRPIVELLEQLPPSWVPPEETTEITRHIARREAMVAASHTNHHGRVPVVYFGWGLLAFDLNLERCLPLARGLWRTVRIGLGYRISRCVRFPRGVLLAKKFPGIVGGSM